MKSLFRFQFALFLFLFVVAFLLIPGRSCAQTEPGNIGGPGTSIRTTAVLTTSDVLSTTFSVTNPTRLKAIHYYIAFTVGSLTSASFTPAAALSGNPVAASYYSTPGTSITVTATGNYHIRVPYSYDGGPLYHGILTKGVGTATSSDAVIKYNLEY